MGDGIINAIEPDEALASDEALERMMTFARRFGVAHTQMAMYAAFPAGLTPEVVHLIRINYAPAAPWIAEADLLLSPLCREVGGDFYEMDPHVRELLLDEFSSNWRFGPSKLKDFAEFMLAYVSRARTYVRDQMMLDFLRAQEMVALAYANPEEAAWQLARAMKKGIDSNDKSETRRMASLAQSLAAPLFAESKVLIYAAGVEKLFERDTERAMRLFGSIGAATQSMNIGGINLPSAAAMSEQMKLSEPAPAEPTPYPLGFTLRATLRGHTDIINRMAWSPDGKQLASPSDDGTMIVWNSDTWDSNQLKPDELKAEGGEIRQVTWSPSENRLAFISAKKLVVIYAFQEIAYFRIRYPQSNQSYCIAWSANSSRLAWVAEEGVAWSDTSSGTPNRESNILELDETIINAIAWSPDGATIAAATSGRSIILWDIESGRQRGLLRSGEESVNNLAWSPDGKILASTIGNLILISDANGSTPTRTVHGHRGYITSIAFSFDGRLLASKSTDGTVRLWRSDTWEQVAVLDEPYPGKGVWSSVAFHPTEPVLATLDISGTAIRIWDLNFKALLGPEPKARTISYKNAKVVLLGDTGVGKTSLFQALAGEPFVPTESTHGLSVKTFDIHEIENYDGSKEVREILLWDLPGKSNYKITNQLHLDDVAVAIIVIDPTADRDFQSSVIFWNDALQQARRIEGNAGPPIEKFLVASRADIMNPRASRKELGLINHQMVELKIPHYSEVSAKDRIGLGKLSDSIRNAIKWEDLPSVSVPELPGIKTALSSSTPTEQRAVTIIQQAKESIGKFLADEFTYRPLISRDELIQAVEKRFEDLIKADELRKHFDTWVRLAQSLGLFKRLNQGRDILFGSQYADMTVAELIEAAREDPRQIGSINESEFLARRPEPSHEYTAYMESLSQDLEKDVIEELILHEIALRVETDGGKYLVFPSLLDFSDQPELKELESSAQAVYSFTGPVMGIYATLLTRLSNSKDFELNATMSNDAQFLRKRTPVRGGRRRSAKERGLSTAINCGIMLNQPSDSQAEITVFFDQQVDAGTRFLFEERVRSYLLRSLPLANVKRQRIFHCRKCGNVFETRIVTMRVNGGLSTLTCPVCETSNSIFDRAEALAKALESTLPEYAQQAGAWQKRERIIAELERKIAGETFDVLLYYGDDSQQDATDIALHLIERGILPFYDLWETQTPHKRLSFWVERIDHIKAAALLIKKAGLIPAQMNLTERFLVKGKPFVPVILPGAKDNLELPFFIQNLPPVDFRIDDPDPIDELIRAIRTPPSSRPAASMKKTSMAKRPAKKKPVIKRSSRRPAPAKKRSSKPSMKKIIKRKK